MGMKIAGAVCIIVACTAMGFSFSFRLRCRYGELTELKKILYLLSGEIRFGGSTLDEAFEMVRDRCEEPYRGFFSALSGELKKGGGRTLSQIWREAVNEKLPDPGCPGKTGTSCSAWERTWDAWTRKLS